MEGAKDGKSRKSYAPDALSGRSSAADFRQSFSGKPFGWGFSHPCSAFVAAFQGAIDLFHDSAEVVAKAYREDSRLLLGNGYRLSLQLSQPGFIRALIERDGEGVLIDWAQDSACRFMPPVAIAPLGHVLHPVDLAVNKVLALGGRDEPRDWVDVLYLDRKRISLGALVFAAVGKDPGLSPSMLLELLGRKGRIQPRDLERIHFSRPPQLQELRQQWMESLQQAHQFVASRPAAEAGHLYVDPRTGKFFAPSAADAYTLHGPSPGGILPRLAEAIGPALSESPEARSDLERFFFGT